MLNKHHVVTAFFAIRTHTSYRIIKSKFQMRTLQLCHPEVPHPIRLESDTSRPTREAEKQMKIKVVFS